VKVILFANTEWYLYNFRLSLIRALIARGVRVLALSPPGPYGQRLIEAGCEWIALPMDRRSLNPLREAILLARLAGIYREFRPDLAHHLTIKCVVYGSFAAALAGTSGVVNAVTGLGHVFTDEGLRSRMLRPVVRGLLRSCFRGRKVRLILQNPDDQAAFQRAKLAPAESVRLIRGSGVNAALFTPVAQRSHGGPVRILLATRLLREKGVLEFVDAARSLKQAVVPAEFWLAGRPDPGNPSSVSQAMIDGWHAEGVVRALGHVETIHELLQQVDMVVLPSYREGTPKILLEAAACGLPIVATDVPGCREIVSHGHNGLLVPARDSAALASAIRLLIADPETRARMGAAGRAKVLAEFDERSVIRQTLDVYRELVAVPE
jgi:glycosyltransferase involved in cell wall biosynthesis